MLFYEGMYPTVDSPSGFISSREIRDCERPFSKKKFWFLIFIKNIFYLTDLLSVFSCFVSNSTFFYSVFISLIVVCRTYPYLSFLFSLALINVRLLFMFLYIIFLMFLFCPFIWF